MAKQDCGYRSVNVNTETDLRLVYLRGIKVASESKDIAVKNQKTVNWFRTLL